MLITFTVPMTGTTHHIQLKDELIQEYKLTIEEMTKYFSPALDKQRRIIHNKVAQPVLQALEDELPNEDHAALADEARKVVTQVFESSLTGRSRVRELQCSGLLI